MNISLHVTDDCNLCCTYCFEGEKHPRRMSEDIGQRAIDLAIRHTMAARELSDDARQDRPSRAESLAQAIINRVWGTGFKAYILILHVIREKCGAIDALADTFVMDRDRVVGLLSTLSSAWLVSTTQTSYSTNREQRSGLRNTAWVMLDRQFSAPGAFVVDFYGGEPLLELPLATKLADYALAESRRFDLNVGFTMATNATLVTDGVMQFVRSRGVSVQVSLDGRAETHDGVRRTRAGRGSFRQAKLGATKLLAHDPYTRVNATYTYETIPELAGNVEYLAGLGFRSIGVGPVLEVPWPDSAFDVLDEQAHLLALYYLEMMEKDEDSYLAPFDRFIRSGVFRGIHPLCGAARERTFAVSTDGTLYPCVRFTQKGPAFAVGSVGAGISGRKFASFRARASKRAVTCKECALASRCFPQCLAINHEATGTMHQPVGEWCEYTKILSRHADRVATNLYRKANAAFLRRFYSQSDPR